jgi:carbamoyltransferase
MSNIILGISAFYHDSAAALLIDGEIVAAAQEERFTRIKHDSSFPVHAINYCLLEAFIGPDDIDLVVFYDNPLITLDRIIKNGINTGQNGVKIFAEGMKSNLLEKLWVADYMNLHFNSVGKLGKVLFSGHHMSHLASSFFPSPFDEALLVSVDGVGEWATTTLAVGYDGKIEILKQINYPHSLGLLYSAFTSYCGFKVNSGEYKLMGLAPYGEPKYIELIYDHLIDVKEDGSYRLNLDYFGFLDSDSTTNQRFHDLFGGPPRLPESTITKKDMDIAASIQCVTEEVVMKLVKYGNKLTGKKNLCLSGGVALNCVSNGKIFSEKLFDKIWVQPAAGDAGGAIGACYVGYSLYGNNPINKTGLMDLQKGSYLGPQYSRNQILAFLDRENIVHKEFENYEDLNIIIASDIAEGKIVGHFCGRMEFGPRALGNRSILGDARNTEMQSKMNLKIKYRESFRPFAPLVLNEDVGKYFKYDEESPYMLMVAKVNDELLIQKNYHSTNNSDVNSQNMIEIINERRSSIPAVTHVDNSARLQTVSKEVNPRLHDLLTKFKELTGDSVLINTSFNVRGEPIVCSPSDAYLCFMRTEMDVLVLDNFLIYKQNQKELQNDENWKTKYSLD